MYQGKRCKRRSNRKLQKTILLLVSVMVLVTVALGGTIAYLLMDTDPVKNKFTPAKVTTVIEEDIDDNVKSNVQIKNTGDVSAYIRAAVVINWQNEAGEIYGEVPQACDTPNCDHTECGKHYTIDYNTQDWEKKGDFWYYNRIVNPRALTTNLINECTVLQGSPEEDSPYKLTVTILGSGVQSTPSQAVMDAWGFVPGA